MKKTKHTKKQSGGAASHTKPQQHVISFVSHDHLDDQKQFQKRLPKNEALMDKMIELNQMVVDQLKEVHERLSDFYDFRRNKYKPKRPDDDMWNELEALDEMLENVTEIAGKSLRIDLSEFDLDIENAMDKVPAVVEVYRQSLETEQILLSLYLNTWAPFRCVFFLKFRIYNVIFITYRWLKKIIRLVFKKHQKD